MDAFGSIMLFLLKSIVNKQVYSSGPEIQITEDTEKYKRF